MDIKVAEHLIALSLCSLPIRLLGLPSSHAHQHMSLHRWRHPFFLVRCLLLTPVLLGVLLCSMPPSHTSAALARSLQPLLQLK